MWNKQNSQRAENYTLNPVREFTFSLSDNINHLKHMLEWLHLFLRKMGFTSQIFSLHEEKDKCASGGFTHILVVDLCQYATSKNPSDQYYKEAGIT